MKVTQELKYAVGLTPLAEMWTKEADSDFGIDIDVETHIADMQSLIDRDNATLLCLHSDEGVIVGYLGMVVFDNPIGVGMIASEHNWFVHPDHRGMGSIKLLRAAQQWAKDQGCAHVVFNASKLASGLHDTICSIYERLGMKHFETSYISEVK